MKVLVIETQIFFDGHGEPETGGERKFISDKLHLLKLDNTKYYDCRVLKYGKNEKNIEKKFKKHECNNYYPEDGYHCIAFQYDTFEIIEQKAEYLKKLIDDYNNMII